MISDLCNFLDLARKSSSGTQIEAVHVFQGISDFVLKVSGYTPKAYTCYILPMLNMIIMKVAKLYIFYAHLIIYVHILLH